MKKLINIAYLLISIMLLTPLAAGAAGRIEWIPDKKCCIAGTTSEIVTSSIYTAQPTTPPEPEREFIGTYTLTAYCGCCHCCGKSDGITSTGTHAEQGRTVAVDPSVIPYGTRLMIGDNYYIAEDCGGAIQGNRIDIYFNDHQQALDFGVKNIDVYAWR